MKRMEEEHRTSNIERPTSKERRPSGVPQGAASTTWDLEERLLEYSARIVRLVETLLKSRASTHLGGQLLRSGTAPLLNHGEAESAESKEDFVHKLKICLKELRETLRCLKLIQRVPLVRPDSPIDTLLQETDELIRIFVASIRTASSRPDRQQPRPTPPP